MLKLLKKEFRLAMHPSTVIFMCFAPMLLIPDYFYPVAFFYATMGIFFTCLQGRENNDIVFSLMLPVSKKDIVKARFMYTVIVELMVMLACVPFVIIAQSLGMTSAAGFDANISLLALAFVFYSVFNFCFFIKYYSNTNKVGIAFVLSTVLSFAAAFIFMMLTFTVPYFMNLDTPDSLYITEKVIFFVVCAIVYILSTFAAYKISVNIFKKKDI